MEPLTAVLTGVIVKSLTAIVAHLGRKGRDFARRGKDVFRVLEKDTILAEKLQNLTGWQNKRRQEGLRSFLVSPDAESILRQIHASQGITKSETYVQPLRAEFIASLSLHLNGSPEDLDEAGGNLFDVLVEGCARALEVMTAEGLLSEEEIKAATRHGLLFDELQGINSNLAILAGTDRPDLRRILKFEEKYREQVANRHGYITPPHFDAARRVAIDELYVSPQFVTTAAARGEEPSQMGVSEILGSFYRGVVLGNPGAGKSTFAEKTCHDLAMHYSERLFGGRQVTPILVVLREYGAEKKTRNWSILQFIEGTARSRYQLEPPPRAFEYLLLNGRAIVIFDGLDELLQSSQRQEIRGDVESFCNLYPSVPVLVTSREVGYEQAPLDKKRFEIFRLAPFDDDQISEYAKKWFALDEDLTTDEKTGKAASFLEESRVVADLRSNPLMLALMCNLYRGEGYIPRNRPDVYEKCAVMLFETWDKSRDMYVPLPFEAHINPAVKDLAYWIYTDEALQPGVTERELVARAADYLCTWRFEDRAEAEKAAKDFIEFSRGRAWVFSDTGSTRAGEDLYQFTHRTFLEYFAAAHLVRIHATPESLGVALFPKLARREWDVVAQLAVQLQNKNLEGAADQFLKSAVKRAMKASQEKQWHLLSFVARCLGFIVPKPAVTREITAVCIERAVAWGRNRSRAKAGRPVAEALGALLRAAPENRATVADMIENSLIPGINTAAEGESLVRLEIASDLTQYLLFGNGIRAVEADLQDFWTSSSNRIVEACWDRILEVSHTHFGPCREMVSRRKISVVDMVGWHGVEALYFGHPLLFQNAVWTSVAEWLVASIVDREPDPGEAQSDWRLEQTVALGRMLLTRPTPWLRHPPVRSFPWMSPGFPSGTRSAIAPDLLFGLFGLLAPVFEARNRSEGPLASLEAARSSQLQSLASILGARLQRPLPSDIDDRIKASGFGPGQAAFVGRWVRHELNLVGPAGRRVAKKARTRRSKT